MPLPPALAARLKKRGLLKLSTTAEPDEEIIAEDYSGETNEENEPPEDEEEEELQVLINNTNLPAGWWRVKDPKSGYFYYWDSETDKVKWIPPAMPKEQIVPIKPPKIQTVQPLPPGIIGPMVGPMIEQTDTINKRPKAPRTSKRREERDSRRKPDDTLDPMDPAAYSDTPRGTWSTGLPKVNEAKTGVDSTATGPLFQMRPYPSPGAVLRANAAVNNKEDDVG